MKKILKYRFIIVLSLAAFFASCNDWTKDESLGLKEADIEKDNPELYAAYLANLREYKKTDHKVLFAGFDNGTSAPYSPGQHIASIPDSVDVVCLMNPDELAPWIISEMATVRQDKGTKFVFNISYPAIEKAFDQYIIENTDEEGNIAEGLTSFVDYVGNYVDQHLTLVGKYGYDGVSALFNGKDTSHLTLAQKLEYLANEAAFMSKFHAWAEQNPDKTFIFEGRPQSLTDKTILQRSEFVVIRTELEKYASGLDYEVTKVVADGGPVDRLVVAVNSVSLDKKDLKTGRYTDSANNLIPCIPVAADWVMTLNAGFTKTGLYILNVQNDYYFSGRSYQNVRYAIETMNPSPKL